MHPRYAPVLFALILSGVMSFAVSGVATVRTTGVVDGIIGLWMSAWMPSWAVAFPTALIVAPLTRRIVASLIRNPSAEVQK